MAPNGLEGLTVAAFEVVQAEGVRIVHLPKQHRDGSYSFYLADPDNLTVQVLYEPTISRLGHTE